MFVEMGAIEADRLGRLLFVEAKMHPKGVRERGTNKTPQDLGIALNAKMFQNVLQRSDDSLSGIA
jgi:hypothetical protein